MDPNPPESGEDFVRFKNPNPDSVEELSETESTTSSSGADEARDQNDVSPDETRNVRPEELSSNVVVLTCKSSAMGGTCDVYLVGTTHVYQESCKEVQAIIDYLKPQVVFLELCSSRVNMLTPPVLKVLTMGELVEMWKKNHNIFDIFYSWFFSQVASELDVFPGSEFRVAYEEAMKYGAKVKLGDRPINTTLLRAWGKMPLWHKTKLISYSVFQACFFPSREDFNRMLKEMDNVDTLTLLIQELSKEFPTLMETLIHERDQYMSSTLLKVASKHSSVVAVVGKGHLQGIKKHWKQPVSIRELMEIPLQNGLFTARKILTCVAVGGVAIISGIYLQYRK